MTKLSFLSVNDQRFKLACEDPDNLKPAKSLEQQAEDMFNSLRTSAARELALKYLDKLVKAENGKFMSSVNDLK